MSADEYSVGCCLATQVFFFRQTLPAERLVWGIIILGRREGEWLIMKGDHGPTSSWLGCIRSCILSKVLQLLHMYSQTCDCSLHVQWKLAATISLNVYPQHRSTCTYNMHLYKCFSTHRIHVCTCTVLECSITAKWWLPVQLRLRDSSISINAVLFSTESVSHKLLDATKIGITSEGVDVDSASCKVQAGPTMCVHHCLVQCVWLCVLLRERGRMDPASTPSSKEMIATHNLHVVVRGREREREEGMVGGKEENRRGCRKENEKQWRGGGEKCAVLDEEVNHSKSFKFSSPIVTTYMQD